MIETPNQTMRFRLAKEVEMELGGSMVEVELPPEDFEFCVTKAIRKYRQRSGSAHEEAGCFLTLVQDVNEYILPEDIVEVRQIFQRGINGISLTNQSLDPFSMMVSNMYMLRPGMGNAGGLLTYELFTGYYEQAGKMFGAYINFNWNTVTKKLTIMRMPRGDNEVFLQVYKQRSDSELLMDPYSEPWIREWAVAEAKGMLGQAYAKFASYAGPTGGVSMKGDTLMTQSDATKEALLLQLTQFADGAFPGWCLMG